MVVIRDRGVFTSTEAGDRSDTSTQFRDNDDFSVDIFEDDVSRVDLPRNVGVAFVKSSDSPRDLATISLNGDDTSTIFVDNNRGNVNFVVSGDTYLGYSVNTDFRNIFSPKITFSGLNTYNYQYFDNGNLYVAGGIYSTGVVYGGNLSGTTKYFNIQHPTQSDKRLVHACLEGPENGVYFRGRLTGSNVIELPEYWTGLVDPESITVSLTQIGYSQDLIVEKIEWGRKILIKSGTGSNIDCYYMINGTRKDVPPLEVELDA